MTGKPRRRAVPARPGLSHERGLWGAGHRVVAGVDEVGRGAWAGPLSVGVAVLCESPRRIPKGLRDSKQLTEDVREAIFDRVAAWCAGWAVGHADPGECDRLGMTAALRLATRRALAQLAPDLVPDAVVLDGTFDFVSPPVAAQLFDADAGDDAADGLAAGLDGALELTASGDGPAHGGAVWAPPVETVVGGDARCASVAAASVLAKVTRDRIMRATADSYPAFDFERNKGYPSPAHQRALCGYGLSAVHRRSWAFVDNLPWGLTSWPGDHRARSSRLDGGLLGQSEHPLADDVVEDLVGSPRDAHPGQPQQELRPGVGAPLP
ncbi:MAG: ribonuclease HII [Acidimicrobiales bacterium]|nr:ribonuclease HII [Acidimicrobiales bacterium]